ncbi:MAG: ABC transporter ATP-binding protein [Chloroflexota bacterium]
MAFLVVEGVRKRFGGLVAVDDVSFEVAAGEIVGLIGPNGAGKTTLFNLISGLYRPDGGRILLDGRRIDGLPPYERCRLGLGRTFQIVQPFADLTTLQNVMLGAFNQVRSEAQAARIGWDILVRVGLADKADWPAAWLTLGDRKRLEVARALATGPRLLMLDEVMAGLTPREVDDTLVLLRELRDSGITLLVIEHVMRAVMSLCDRVVVLHHGQKIADGTPVEVASFPQVIEAYLGEETEIA